VRLLEHLDHQIPDKTAAFMFRTLGIALIRERERAWQDMGTYALECAVEFGDDLAALHLCAIENNSLANRRSSFQASPAAKRRVQDLADEGTHWTAMAIQAGQFKQFANRPTKVNQGFELAKYLVDQTEADPMTRARGPESVNCDPPWRLLRDFAKLKGEKSTEIRAVALGATQYNDPEAAEQLAESTEVDLYSGQWVELMTKAAMGGSNTACWNIGKYWLEKKGWYPCTGKVSIDDESSLGFDWLELAAASREPLRAAILYLTIALVCRENNCSELGRGYLESAVDTIETGDGESEKKMAAVQRLKTMINDWWEDIVFEQETAKAAFFLKAPRMPI